MWNVSSVIVGLFLLVSCASTEPKDPLTSSSIEIQGVNYRTGGASGALLGSIGYLSGGGVVGGHTSFDRKKIPDYKELKLKYEGIIDQDLKSSVSVSLLVDAEATIQRQLDAQAKVGGKILSDTERKVHYHLISIESPDDVVLALNSVDNSRSLDLLELGKDKSRIITKVIVAYGYTSSRSLEMSAQLGLKLSTKNDKSFFSVGNLTATAAKIGADANTGLDLTNQINLSDGMIVGYSYDILCWQKTDNGGKKIRTTILDVYNRPQKCPDGKDDPSKL